MPHSALDTIGRAWMILAADTNKFPSGDGRGGVVDTVAASAYKNARKCVIHNITEISHDATNINSVQFCDAAGVDYADLALAFTTNLAQRNHNIHDLHMEVSGLFGVRRTGTTPAGKFLITFSVIP